MEEVEEVEVEVEDCLRPVEADLCTADWDLQQECGDQSVKQTFAEISQSWRRPLLVS